MTNATSAYDKYAHIREKLQVTLNKQGKLIPFSFESYKKTPEEKMQLKIAKAEHKEKLRIQNGLI